MFTWKRFFFSFYLAFLAVSYPAWPLYNSYVSWKCHILHIKVLMKSLLINFTVFLCKSLCYVLENCTKSISLLWCVRGQFIFSWLLILHYSSSPSSPSSHSTSKFCVSSLFQGSPLLFFLFFFLFLFLFLSWRPAINSNKEIELHIYLLK